MNTSETRSSRSQIIFKISIPKNFATSTGNLQCWRFLITEEAVAQTCSVKKVFLEISQNSQETPVPESPF